MNAIETMTVQGLNRELFCVVEGREFCVELNLRTRDGEGENYWWVSIKEYQPDLKWYKLVYSESAHDCSSEMEALRCGLRVSHGRMKSWLNSWRIHRRAAMEERGGKRGYYTRYANQALAEAKKYAGQWKLCKAVWKQITKL